METKRKVNWISMFIEWILTIGFIVFTILWIWGVNDHLYSRLFFTDIFLVGIVVLYRVAGKIKE